MRNRIRPRMGMRCNIQYREPRKSYKEYPSPHGDEMQHVMEDDTNCGKRIRPRMGMRCNRVQYREPRKSYKEYPSPHGDEMQHAVKYIRDNKLGYPSPHGDEMQLRIKNKILRIQIRIRPRMGMRCNSFYKLEGRSI